MKIEQVDPTAIEIPHRLRAVDPAKVKQLAESMGAIGLQQPVTVWSPVDGELELVAGAHRVKAACDLGWEWIDCIFADGMTDIDRQLWEIDENLMRAELSPTEMAEHLAKREDLWGRRDSVASCNTNKGPGRPTAFTTDTAEKTGVNRSTVHRALSRAKAIPEDVRDQIKGTKLDTGTYLDWLKVMNPDDQRAQVTTDLAEGVKPKAPKPTPAVDWFEALKRDWGMASKDERRRFDEWRQDK